MSQERDPLNRHDDVSAVEEEADVALPKTDGVFIRQKQKELSRPSSKAVKVPWSELLPPDTTTTNVDAIKNVLYKAAENGPQDVAPFCLANWDLREDEKEIPNLTWVTPLGRALQLIEDVLLFETPPAVPKDTQTPPSLRFQHSSGATAIQLTDEALSQALRAFAKWLINLMESRGTDAFLQNPRKLLSVRLLGVVILLTFNVGYYAEQKALYLQECALPMLESENDVKSENDVINAPGAAFVKNLFVRLAIDLCLVWNYKLCVAADVADVSAGTLTTAPGGGVNDLLLACLHKKPEGFLVLQDYRPPTV